MLKNNNKEKKALIIKYKTEKTNENINDNDFVYNQKPIYNIPIEEIRNYNIKKGKKKI